MCLSDGQGPGVRVCLPRAGWSLYPSVSQQICVAVNESNPSSDIAMHVETAWNCKKIDNIMFIFPIIALIGLFIWIECPWPLTRRQTEQWRENKNPDEPDQDNECKSSSLLSIYKNWVNTSTLPLIALNSLYDIVHMFNQDFLCPNRMTSLSPSLAWSRAV